MTMAYHASRRLRRLTVASLLFLAFCLMGALSQFGAQTVTVQAGVVSANHAQAVSFSAPFTSVPVVLTSAQSGGRAVSSFAATVTTSGFTVNLTNDAGAGVSGATLHWIAVIPGTDSRLAAGTAVANSMSSISFGRSLASVPVIVTNAGKDGKALISGAADNRANGFTLSLGNDGGANVSNAQVSWLAVIPDPANQFKGEVLVRNNGDAVSFSPAFAGDAAYVAAAQPDAIAAASVARRDGFTLSLIRHDGTAVTQRWTQWLAYPRSSTTPADTAAPTWPGGSLYYANVTFTGLTLNWSTAQDNVGVTSYRIYQDGTLIATVPAAAGTNPSYIVTNLAAGNHLFKVQAGDAAGNWSTSGPTTSVYFADRIAPTWPAGTSLTGTTITPTGLTLNWTAAQDNVGVVTYRITAGPMTFAVSSTSRTYAVYGLTPNTQYIFKVEAGDAAGNWSTTGPSSTLTSAKLPASISFTFFGPSQVSLKYQYGVSVYFFNSGQARINSVEVTLKEDGVTVGPSPLTRTYINPGQATSSVTWTFCKNWQWWTSPFVQPLHDLSKTYRYFAECRWVDEYNVVHTDRVPASGDSSVTVSVPQWKRDWSYTAATAFTAMTACTIGAAALWWCAPAAGVAAGGAIVEGLIYVYALDYVNDPPELDRDYKTIAVMKEAKLDLAKPTDPLEDAFGQMTLGAWKLANASDCMRISRNRAWSAFAYGDETALAKQAEATAAVASTASGYAKNMAASCRNLANALDKSGAKIDPTEVLKIQEKLKKEGFSKEQLAYIKKIGLDPTISKIMLAGAIGADAKDVIGLADVFRKEAASAEALVKVFDELAKEVRGLAGIKDEKKRQELLFSVGMLTGKDLEKGITRLQ